MKLLFIVLALICLNGNTCWSQNRAQATQLVREGQQLQRNGRYPAALKKYDQALQQDPGNLTALTEKSYVLLALQNYREALLVSEKALREHRPPENLLMAYLNRANALDYLGWHQQALKAFDEGLSVYPNSQLLNLNKGITLANLNRLPEAQAAFERAVRAEPEESDSHLAMARLAQTRQQRIPALLSYLRFLILEPEGKRARQALKQVKKLMQPPITEANPSQPQKKTDEPASIHPPDNLNDFGAAERAYYVALSMPENAIGKKVPEHEQFAIKFKLLSQALKNEQSANSGFFWDYYAPYFIELYDVQLVQPFAYLVHASGRNKAVLKWLETSEEELSRFFAWADIYPWDWFK